MDYTTGVGMLESRARMAVPVLWGFSALSLLVAGSEALEALGIVDVEVGTGALDVAAGFAYLAYAVAFLASVIFVAMWIHRAHSNLAFLGIQGLDYTPGWSIGWFFIPIANLFKPFGAMRELWNASFGARDQFDAESPSLMKIWWGAWIAGNILSVVSEQVISAGSFEAGMFVSVASTLVLAAAAIYLVKIINSVTDAQIAGLSTGEVFS